MPKRWQRQTFQIMRRGLKSARFGEMVLMQPVQGDAFDDLFRTFERTAFHLELKDSYHTPHEAGPFDLYMKGKPDDFAWHQPWLRLVREATQAGKSITPGPCCNGSPFRLCPLGLEGCILEHQRW